MTTTFTLAGTDLSTIGKITLIDDYLDIPQRRSSDLVIPYHPGAVFVQKYFDARTVTMGITITTASATLLEAAIETLKGLVNSRTEQTLTMVMEGGSSRTLPVTVNKTMQVKRQTPSIAKAVIEFASVSPYWRGSSAIADNTLAIDASPKTMTVTNTGTAEERSPTIIIHGAFTSVTLNNTTTGANMTYTGSIGTGETVTIGTTNGEHYATLSTGSANVIGNVTHSGSAALLPLNAGANTLSITSAGRDGNSTVKVTFYPPFL